MARPAEGSVAAASSHSALSLLTHPSCESLRLLAGSIERQLTCAPSRLRPAAPLRLVAAVLVRDFSSLSTLPQPYPPFSTAKMVYKVYVSASASCRSRTALTCDSHRAAPTCEPLSPPQPAPTLLPLSGRSLSPRCEPRY